MANRYWVGGTGTWNGTSTTNWSTATGLSFTASCTGTVLTTTGSPALVAGMTVWSSTFVSLGTVVSGSANTWVVSVGGTYASQGMSAATVGASVPTSADNVFFDANSNSSTTAFTVTMATVAAVCADFDATAVDGVMTLGGTVGIDVYGSFLWPTTNFTRSYTGTTTFRATSTGKTINTNGRALAGTATFDGVGGGWTLASAFTTPSAINLTNGVLNFGGFTITGFNLGTSNSNARTLAFNGGTFVITGSASTGNQTLWSAATATNLTVTGTPTVNVINNSTNSGFTRTFTHGATVGGSETNSINLNIQAGDVGSLVSLSGVFKNVNFTGCSSTLTNGSRYIYGNLTMGSGMTLTAGANGTNFAGASGTQQITSAGLNFDFPVNFGYSFATTAASGNGTTATLTYSTSIQTIAVGSTIIVSGVTPAGYNGTYTVTASTNSTVSYANATTGAQTVAGTIVNGGSTTYTLLDALTVATPTSATARTITLNTGTLNLNNFTLSNFGAVASSSAFTRAIAFGTGNITCTYNTAASNTVWNCPTITNFSITGTPTVNVTGNSSGAFTRTVSHGNTAGGTEPNAITVNVSAGTDTIGINGCFIDVNLTGFAGTLAGNTRFIYGNLIIGSGTTVAASTLITSFCKASGAQQITTNAKNLDFPVNFGYTLATTAATGNGTTATLTIGSTINCIAVGSTLIVANVVPAGYNGTYTVTASTNTTVSYANATTGAQTVAGSVANAGSTTYTLQDALSVGTSSGRAVGLFTGTLNLNNFTFTLYGNFSSSVSFARTLAFGAGNITITQAGVGQTIWNVALATNLTVTGTPTVNVTGAPPSGTTRFISHGQTVGGSEANSVSFYISAGAEPFTIQGFIRNLDFTGYTAALNNSARNIYGNLTLSSGMSLVAGTSATTFASTSATVRTITTNGQNLDFPVTFSGVGGSWQLQDALTVGTSRLITLNAGAFDSNNQSITCGTFGFTNSNTKTLNLGTSTVTITGGTSTAGFVGSNAGTTYNVINSTIVFTNTGAFSGGQGSAVGNQFGTVTMSAAGGTLYLGTSTGITVARCTTLNNTVSPCTITNGCTTGFTVTNFNVSGTAGNLVTFNSNTAGTARTINKTSGTTDSYYLNIQDSTATGGTWNAYESTNSGNNTGWNFIHLRSIDETVSALDSVLVAASTFSAINIETVTATDVVYGVPSFSTQVDESSSATDAIYGVPSFSTQVDESAVATDVVYGVAGFITQVDESSSATDAIYGVPSFSTQVDESSSATDVVYGVPSFSTQVDETVSALDSVLVAASTFSAVNAESATAVDIITTLGVLNSALAETATGSETNTAQLTLPTTITESATGSETNVATIGFAATILESALGADTALVAPSTFGAAVLEIANALDTLVAVAVFLASVSETSQGADTILARFLWEVIDDSQTAAWQNINDAQTPGWAALNTAQSTSWQNIDNAQGSGWTNINDAQTPGWGDIPTAE